MAVAGFESYPGRKFGADGATRTWDVFPSDGESSIVLTDCDGNVMSGASVRSTYCGDINGLIAPYLPYSPNGATGVAVDGHLSFIGDANLIYLGVGSPADLSEVCDQPYGSTRSNPFDPGLLEPNTTYYWRAGVTCVPTCVEGEEVSSDVWSFTTSSGPVASEQSTWGRVKAMYR